MAKSSQGGSFMRGSQGELNDREFRIVLILYFSTLGLGLSQALGVNLGSIGFALSCFAVNMFCFRRLTITVGDGAQSHHEELADE